MALYKIIIILVLILLFPSKGYFIGFSPIFKKNSYTYNIVELPHKTYGYTISYNQKKIISQNVIPGCGGNYGFEKRKDCKRVAQLVCKKLTNNNLPTISEEDLLSLNIKCK